VLFLFPLVDLLLLVLLFGLLAATISHVGLLVDAYPRVRPRALRVHESWATNQTIKAANREKHHFAHPRRRSAIAYGTSCLPIAPPDVRCHIGDDRRVDCHRRASGMVSDVVRRRWFQRRIMASEDKTARVARTVPLVKGFKLSVMPAVTTAVIASVAMMALFEASCMFPV
jgi:hypothetical protein